MEGQPQGQGQHPQHGHHHHNHGHHHHNHGHHQHGHSHEANNQLFSKLAPTYNRTDCTSLTFFYTLINMIELQSAKHILEVGCGTGKLLPQALMLKPKESTFLALDVSSGMLNICRQNMKDYVEKIGVTDSVQEWMKKHHLEIKEGNAQEKIDVPYKFDRIIINLVLHHVEDPVAMLKNLYQRSEEGCLLAIGELADDQKNDIRKYYPDAYKEKGLEPKEFPHPNLYNKIQGLGEQTGWETLLVWDQNSPFPFYKNDKKLEEFAGFIGRGDQVVEPYVLKKYEEKIKEKSPVYLSGQLLILRKK